MRVWHSPWSWLKLIVAAESVAGNTRTGMLTRLIFMNPFHVGLAAIPSSPSIREQRRTDYRIERLQLAAPWRLHTSAQGLIGESVTIYYCSRGPTPARSRSGRRRCALSVYA